MKVAVIGAAGRMGRWFTRYFTEKGVATTTYDIDQKGSAKTAEAYGARSVADVGSAVVDADFVVISVPISATVTVVSDVLKRVKRGVVVAEITSFKKQILPHLERSNRADVTLLSIHPMFGHGAKSLSGHRIVVVPLRDEEAEITTVKTIFPEAEVISAAAEEHDAAMAAVLSLTHFANLVFAAALPEKDIDRIRRLAGTSFSLQLTLAEAILHDDPEFLADLQIDSQYAPEYIDRFVSEAEALGRLVDTKDRRRLIARIRSLNRKMREDRQYDRAYRKMYEIMDALLGA